MLKTENFKSYKIRSNKPAQDWSESLLLGNGFMGAAIYGGLFKEHIDLSEITFFSGEKNENNSESGAIAFQKMRQYLMNEQYQEATEAAEGFIGKKANYGTNLPVGQLKVEFKEVNDSNPKLIEDYTQQLDISTGLVTIEYTFKDLILHREAFVSYPDQALFYKIKSNQPISLKIYFDNEYIPYNTNVKNDAYYFDIQALETIHSDGKTGVKLTGKVQIIETEGSVFYYKDGITVENTKDMVLKLTMETDFLADQSTIRDTHTSNKSQTLDYKQIKQRHIQDVENYMSRVKFNLYGSDDTSGLMLQYGRYLLLSSSRKDSPLPTHLQGIWNDNVACRIGWTCDMHLDINTQMNYWLSEPGNLSECHEPLFHWMENSLIPSGRITAKKSYGYEGWTADLVSNAWGFSAPYWSKTISPCPTGGIWMASDFWEHYAYTKDRDFLIHRAYPVLEEAVSFFIQYVFEEKGAYTSGPSISPENNFVIEDNTYYFSNGCTYEILMIRELFEQYMKVCEELNLTNEKLALVKRILPKLLPYRVLEDGTLAEFQHNYPSGDPWHRHTSHLLGLFPYAQITPDKTPNLARAVQETIRQKLSPYENWEDTGWARSMLMLYMARLKEGEAAYWHIQEMQRNLMSSNYLVLHPPTRGAASFKPVYELDGNTGISMCILEMLIQSHSDRIHLLPALPKAWEKGSIEGVIVRGGIEVKIYWENHRLIKAIFTSAEDMTTKVKYQEKCVVIQLNKNEPTIFTA